MLTPVGQVYGGKFQYLVETSYCENDRNRNLKRNQCAVLFLENSMRKWLIDDKIKNMIGKEQKQFMEIEHNLLQSTIKLYHV